jgi:tRNA pseudouridine38-40 synthase
MRLALGVEYNGTSYHGWQLQSGVNTVQAVVEAALSSVANHAVRVICAGRTDTGVHAVGQVVHFDTTAVRTEHSWIFGANANLPDDVSITWAREIADDFHARYSAIRRHYRYIIFNRHVRPALLAGNVSWNYRPLDCDRMHVAGQYLIGEHDFSSYRALECQSRTPMRNVHSLEVVRRGSYVTIDIVANAFLHHMVRNIAGVLMTIGAGDRQPIWAKEVLDLRDRTLGGVTAPPFGLYLMAVHYPETFDIPQVDTDILV